MRRSAQRLLSASALLLLTVPALAQTAPAPSGRTVTSTGQTMPPVGRSGSDLGAVKPGTEAQMLKAQRAAQARDKAWDARMQRTMGSICKGC